MSDLGDKIYPVPETVFLYDTPLDLFERAQKAGWVPPDYWEEAISGKVELPGIASLAKLAWYEQAERSAEAYLLNNKILPALASAASEAFECFCYDHVPCGCHDVKGRIKEKLYESPRDRQLLLAFAWYTQRI